MSPVIHRKVLENIRDLLEPISVGAIGQLTEQEDRAARLLVAISAALKTKRSVRLARARKAESDADRQTEWERVRGRVLERAGRRCENCGVTQEALAADHMFGGYGRRVTLQSKFTVWALCFQCDTDKTRNSPSAAHWLEAFGRHAQRIVLRQYAIPEEVAGYQAAADFARVRLESLQIQGRAS